MEMETTNYNTPRNVCILSCNRCKTFITNRGFETRVRGNVVLTTDLMPMNCNIRSAKIQSSRSCRCINQQVHCRACGFWLGHFNFEPCNSGWCCGQRMDPRPISYPQGPHTPALNYSFPSAVLQRKFYFIESQILWEERLYIRGERGVKPFQRSQEVLNLLEGGPNNLATEQDTDLPLLGSGEHLYWHQVFPTEFVWEDDRAKPSRGYKRLVAIPDELL